MDKKMGMAFPVFINGDLSVTIDPAVAALSTFRGAKAVFPRFWRLAADQALPSGVIPILGHKGELVGIFISEDLEFDPEDLKRELFDASIPVDAPAPTDGL